MGSDTSWATARALIVQLPKPSTFAKFASMVVVSSTSTALTGAHASPPARQVAVTAVVTPGTFVRAFFDPDLPLYLFAWAMAAVLFGNCCPPARAAASADAWMLRCA